MHQITIEQQLANTLTDLTGQAMLCDAEGRVIGVFSPVTKPQQVSHLQLEPPLSITQTEELRKVRTGKPLEDILKSAGF